MYFYLFQEIYQRVYKQFTSINVYTLLFAIINACRKYELVIVFA